MEISVSGPLNFSHPSHLIQYSTFWLLFPLSSLEKEEWTVLSHAMTQEPWTANTSSNWSQNSWGSCCFTDTGTSSPCTYRNQIAHPPHGEPAVWQNYLSHSVMVWMRLLPTNEALNCSRMEAQVPEIKAHFNRHKDDSHIVFLKLYKSHYFNLYFS